MMDDKRTCDQESRKQQAQVVSAVNYGTKCEHRMALPSCILNFDGGDLGLCSASSCAAVLRYWLRIHPVLLDAAASGRADLGATPGR